MTSLPTLVVVSGPPGAGKTTLAHEIARAVGCPATCRGEIKEGKATSWPAGRCRFSSTCWSWRGRA
jgi:MoxR-like ATPase